MPRLFLSVCFACYFKFVCWFHGIFVEIKISSWICPHWPMTPHLLTPSFIRSSTQAFLYSSLDRFEGAAYRQQKMRSLSVVVFQTAANRNGGLLEVDRQRQVTLRGRRRGRATFDGEEVGGAVVGRIRVEQRIFCAKEKKQLILQVIEIWSVVMNLSIAARILQYSTDLKARKLFKMSLWKQRPLFFKARALCTS